MVKHTQHGTQSVFDVNLASRHCARPPIWPGGGTPMSGEPVTRARMLNRVTHSENELFIGRYTIRFLAEKVHLIASCFLFVFLFCYFFITIFKRNYTKSIFNDGSSVHSSCRESSLKYKPSSRSLHQKIYVHRKKTTENRRKNMNWTVERTYGRGQSTTNAA